MLYAVQESPTLSLQYYSLKSLLKLLENWYGNYAGKKGKGLVKGIKVDAGKNNQLNPRGRSQERGGGGYAPAAPGTITTEEKTQVVLFPPEW